MQRLHHVTQERWKSICPQTPYLVYLLDAIPIATYILYEVILRRHFYCSIEARYSVAATR
ncbi:hypothetical protein FIBSPDRAFT_442719 [Athelia psychrophila]|uniref:Uncharacterized protein n=1 Tax=Athelia psychrophila TaxID=1759441 RepID=A0A166MIS6_9AGAM|nr:hypothetical protein FIBSPDRAFT_442719 [Fibularhizoctonia sp. CBS 109695]